MKGCYRKMYLRPLVVTMIALLLVACNDLASTFRTFTYPPDFTYVSRAELDSRMHQLAYELQQLDLALAAEHDGPPGLQQQVIGILRDIERIGGNLQAGEAGSNPPFFQAQIASVRGWARQART